MEFFNSFIPVFIKYDFMSDIMGPSISKNWTECRLNMKPTPGSYRNIQLNVYPKCYDEMLPYFSIDIDYTNIRCGPVRSRSKANVYGILWSCGGKKSRIFIAFENKAMNQKFSKYFRKLQKFFTIYNNCKDENKVSSKNVNSSECNEAEQMTRHTKSHANVSAEQMMRVSDASGSDDEVVLRPKSQHQANRRLARPFAVISGLFNRESNQSGGNSSNQEEINEQSPKSLAFYDNTNDNCKQQKKSKRKTWNIFKLKKKNRDASPSFQHFAEPLNVERVSLPIGSPMDSDAEWYDLNRDEMSLFEARVSDIINEFNGGYQRVAESESESESESIYRCNIGRHLTVSSNILWSHNLSLSCQSNINLLGANINKHQIHSDVFIEEGDTLPQTVYASGLDASFISTDFDGYAVMQPIPHKYIKPIMLIDERSYSSDELSNGSSGLSTISRASIDSSPSIESNVCSPTASTVKPMQKVSKKRRLQIKSRKLLEMLHVKPTQLQSNGNVTPTPQNKLPSAKK